MSDIQSNRATSVIVPRQPQSGRIELNQLRGSKRSRTRFMLLTLVLASLSALLYSSVPSQSADSLTNPSYEARAVSPQADFTADERSTIELFREASPSVVNIRTSAIARNGMNLNVTKIPRGAGTGFIYDDEGHIVTNFHVLMNATSASVTLHDQSTWSARLVGADPDQDLAVLKIDASSDQLRPIMIGSSSDLQVGQTAIAIGNPFGLDHTLTTGVISGLGREITSVTNRSIQGAIQTDAAINPGNSGGPLLDSSGRLIGVNTSIVSPSGAYAGIGFAVPVDTVSRVVPNLIRHGSIERPALGIVADDRAPRRLGIEGVMVMSVVPDSGAEAAGLQATRFDEQGATVWGDIIVALDGTPTKSLDVLLDTLATFEVGQTIDVTVNRNGVERVISLTLQAKQSL